MSSQSIISSDLSESPAVHQWWGHSTGRCRFHLDWMLSGGWPLCQTDKYKFLLFPGNGMFLRHACEKSLHKDAKDSKIKSNLLSGSDAQGVRVHCGAVMQQDPRHGFSLLLQVEWFIPVSSALVVLVSWPINHCKHNGHIQSVVVFVLYVPHEYRHRQTRVLRRRRWCRKLLIA